jgi:hypothetical protein
MPERESGGKLRSIENPSQAASPVHFVITVMPSPSARLLKAAKFDRHTVDSIPERGVQRIRQR